jgi:RimJ/RimL family protein N-acetyltransferase
MSLQETKVPGNTKNVKRRAKAKAVAFANTLMALPDSSARIWNYAVKNLNKTKCDEVIEMVNKAFFDRYGEQIDYENLLDQHLFWMELGVSVKTLPHTSDGKVVSSAALQLDHDYKLADWNDYKIEIPHSVTLISAVATDKLYRNKGYCTKVIKEVIEYVKKNLPPKHHHIYLEATADNPASQKVYLKLGFIHVASRSVVSTNAKKDVLPYHLFKLSLN